MHAFDRLDEINDSQTSKVSGKLLWKFVGIGVFLYVVYILLFQVVVITSSSMEATYKPGDRVLVVKPQYGFISPATLPFLDIALPVIKTPAFTLPYRGEPVLFIFPGKRDQVESETSSQYLKRCVALPGDVIRIRFGAVYVNEERITEPSTLRYKTAYAEEYDSLTDKSLTFPVGKNYSRDFYGPLRIPKQGDTVHITSENWLQWETFIKREGHEVSFDGSNMVLDGATANAYVIERDYCFVLGDNRHNSVDSRYFGFVPTESIVGTVHYVLYSPASE